jgi:hypothetical protein
MSAIALRAGVRFFIHPLTGLITGLGCQTTAPEVARTAQPPTSLRLAEICVMNCQGMS